MRRIDKSDSDGIRDGLLRHATSFQIYAIGKWTSQYKRLMAMLGFLIFVQVEN